MYLIKQSFRKLYRRKLRKKLSTKEASIICNNCCGGIIYYDLGLRFDSPTINLSIRPDDYLLFLENLKEATEAEVTEDQEAGLTYPVGKIFLKDGRSIRLYFKHYKTFEEAKEKWNERRQRLNWDKIYVLFEMGRNTEPDLLKRFFSLPFDRKCAIVDRVTPEYENTQYLKFYQIYDITSNVTIMDYRKGIFAYKRYLNDFDYVSWLNQSE